MEIYKSFCIDKISRTLVGYNKICIVHFMIDSVLIGYYKGCHTYPFNVDQGAYVMEKMSFLDLILRFEIDAKDYVPELIEGNKMDLL